MSTIAERLLLLRGKAKQGDFAKILEVNPNTLRSYENGRTSPNQEFLEQICVQFSVSPEWLLLGRGPMRPGEPVAPPSSSEHPACASVRTPDGARPPEALCASGGLCARCASLEARLAEMERERRELTAENRELTTEVRHLWSENGNLREKCARLEERQYQRSVCQDGGEAVGSA